MAAAGSTTNRMTRYVVYFKVGSGGPPVTFEQYAATVGPDAHVAAVPAPRNGEQKAGPPPGSYYMIIEDTGHSCPVSCNVFPHPGGRFLRMDEATGMVALRLRTTIAIPVSDGRMRIIGAIRARVPTVGNLVPPPPPPPPQQQQIPTHHTPL
jgi:hypothetical protein